MTAPCDQGPGALLAVFASKRTRGVNAPGFEGKTYDWRARIGAPENTARIIAQGAVLGLEAVFARRWSTDAHFVPYVLFGPDGAPLATQPRINKPGLSWLLEQGFSVRTRSSWADLDNPGHAPWTEALQERALEEARTVEALRTGPWYFTGRGRRVGVLWDRWVDVLEIERTVETWLDMLEAQGLTPDRTCRDWTRLYRCAWVVREDGVPQRQLAWLDGASEVAPPAIAAARPRVARPKKNGPTSGPVSFGTELAPEWATRTPALSESVLAVESEWHTLALSFSGALCERGVASAQVPAIVAAVFVGTRADDRPQDRVDAARTTVQRFAAGEPITGEEHLRDGWPEVHGALVRALADLEGVSVESLTVARARAMLSETRDEEKPLGKLPEQLARAIRETLPGGITGAATPCGAGKTRGFIDLVNYLALLPKELRPKRIVYLCPTTALAVQTACQTLSWLRLFSPGALTDTSGAPVCRLIESAVAFAAGGQSIRREMCEGGGEDPCQYRKGCAAAEGWEGDPDGFLIVAPVALTRPALKQGGKHALVVVDELVEPLVSERITLADFATLEKCAYFFAPKFWARVLPLVCAVRAYTEHVGAPAGDMDSPEDSPLVSMVEMVGQSAPRVPASVLIDAGIDPELRGDALTAAIIGTALNTLGDTDDPARVVPPLRTRESRMGRAKPSHAKRFERPSYVLSLLLRGVREPLHHGATGHRYYAGRVHETKGKRSLSLVGRSEPFEDLMAHEGPVVVMDACGQLLRAALDGRRPEVRHVSINVADGVEVQRTLLVTSSATMTGIMPRGAHETTGSLDMARVVLLVRQAVDFFAEDPATKVAAAFMPKELATVFALVLRPDDVATTKLVKEARSSRESLEAAAELLRPVLALWPGELLTGHYGALRGLDAWKDVDAIVTIVDPRPDVGTEYEKGLYAGRSGLEAMALVNMKARAELQQAHGRGRPFHRTKPLRLLHIGALPPFGWEGRPPGAVKVRVLPVGRPPGTAAMAAAEMKRIRTEELGMSQRQFAKLLHISSSMATRYESGAVPIGEALARHVLARVSAVRGPAPLTPNSDLSVTRGSRSTPHIGVSGALPAGAPEGEAAPPKGVSGTLHVLRETAPAGDETSRGAA